MSLIKLNPIERKKMKSVADAPVKVLSVRAAVQSAINEFHAMYSKLPYEDVRDAYAHLLVGRGFDRASAQSDKLADSAKAKPYEAAAQHKEVSNE